MVLVDGDRPNSQLIPAVRIRTYVHIHTYLYTVNIRFRAFYINLYYSESGLLRNKAELSAAKRLRQAINFSSGIWTQTALFML